MSCKINYFSANEPLFFRFARRSKLLPFPELFHRGLNLVLKKLRGGLLPFPQSVHIEVTNHCNLFCPMCPHSTQPRDKGFMKIEMFEDIINQCKRRFSLEKVALMGLGEPFLHPELIQMSQFAKSCRIPHVFTSTNATLLGEELSGKVILESGFDLLAISLDGATKNTYEGIRRGAVFEKVVENIISFIKIRKSHKRKNPRLVLQFLVMRENYNEKEVFVRFWKDKLDDQDTIFLRDVDTFGGQVPDFRLAHQMPRRRRMSCLQLWKDLIISWQGDVSVCCKDVNYLLKVGNIKDACLESIWNNNKWDGIRHFHKNSEWQKIPLCANCSEWNQ